MGLNRLRGMWQSDEDSGQEFLFRDIKASDTEFDTEGVRRSFAPTEQPKPTQPVQSISKYDLAGVGEPLRILLDRCMELVAREPEVTLSVLPITWEMWFKDSLLSAAKCSGLPLGLKLRLMAFCAVLIPFFKEGEKERVRQSIENLSPKISTSAEEILTEQDLLHTEWLVRAILRSKDTTTQMDALSRSILNRVSVYQAA